MINRQKLIKALNSYHYTAIGMRCGKKVAAEIIKGYHDHVIEVINSQPPADVPDTNVREWIPCSSGELPKQGEHVIGTFENDKGVRAVAEMTYFPDVLEPPWPMIAWMPLPEPYKGE